MRTHFANGTYFTYRILSISDRYERDVTIITGTLEPVQHIIVPSSIQNMQVWSIDEQAFGWQDSLVSIVLPEGLRYIYKHAFIDCYNLQKISLPSSLKGIGHEAFAGCRSLTDITLPEGLEAIGRLAFEDCIGLSALHFPFSLREVYGNPLGSRYQYDLKISLDPNHPFLYIQDDVLFDRKKRRLIAALPSFSAKYYQVPAGIQVVANRAFIGQSSLIGLDLGDDTQRVEAYAFGWCDNLQRVSSADNLLSLGKGTFKECGRLYEIILSSSLTEIPDSCFNDCQSLEKIHIPDSVHTIGRYAFFACRFSSIKLPQNLRRIKNSAFAFCYPLSSIDLPENLQRIGANAFYACENLNKISLPESLKRISASAFIDTNASFEVDADNPRYEVVDGQLIDWQTRTLLLYLKNRENILVKVPKGVEIIAKKAFAGSTSLKGVHLPEGLKHIHKKAFKDCSELSIINLPDSLISIGDNAFAKTALHEVQIPASLQLLGDSVFEECKALKHVSILAQLTTLPKEIFRSCKTLTSCELPCSLLKIGQGAFSGCEKLEMSNLPENLSVIESGVFADCFSLRLERLPNSIESLGSFAFYSCQSPCFYILPHALRILDGNPFAKSFVAFKVPDAHPHLCMIDDVLFDKEQSTLFSFPFLDTRSSYKIPIGTRRIGESAFCCNSHLFRIEFPEGLEEIGRNAFSVSERLYTIIFPKSLKRICANAFHTCQRLEEIDLPNGIEIIEQGAFSGCKSLAKVYLPRSLKSIGLYNEANVETGVGLEKPFYENIGAFFDCNPNLEVVAHEGSFAMKWAQRVGFRLHIIEV